MYGWGCVVLCGLQCFHSENRNTHEWVTKWWEEDLLITHIRHSLHRSAMCSEFPRHRTASIALRTTDRHIDVYPHQTLSLSPVCWCKQVSRLNHSHRPVICLKCVWGERAVKVVHPKSGRQSVWLSSGLYEATIRNNEGSVGVSQNHFTDACHRASEYECVIYSPFLSLF